MTPTLNVRMAQTRKRLSEATGEVRSLAVAARRCADEINELTELADLHDKAAHVLTAVGEQRQDDAQRQIEALVTQGLRSIFGQQMSFHLVPGVRAKTPVVDFRVRSTMDDGSIVETDVMDARGGGLAATVGFLLRVVILLLSKHRQDTVLFLDETFAHVSAEYTPRVVAFLKELVERTGVQIVMVTHDDAYAEAADTVYRFELRDGVTRVRSL